MTPGRALLCLRELKSLEYQGFSGKKKLHGNSIKITVQWWQQLIKMIRFQIVSFGFNRI